MTGSTDSTSAGLTSLLTGDAVPWDVLHERHGAVLGLVERLLGVVPNCDRYLEIWPPAFRSYNVMVPNLLNLPAPVFGIGAAPPSAIGLAMYVASRTAGCAYCSAHSCSFALRRGASPEAVVASLFGQDTAFDRGQLAAIAVARSLAGIPCALTAAEKDELIASYGSTGAEWVVLSVVMMGFLNKFMDALGVELEQELVDEVTDTLGDGWHPGRAGLRLDPASPQRPAPPADGWRTKLGLLPLLPRAVRYDRRLQRGVPTKAAEVSAFLQDRFGHDFPVLSHLRSGRARRAIATMLREHLSAEVSVLGLELKLQVGATFAGVVGSEVLAADVQRLAAASGVNLFGDPLPEHAAALELAGAASSSPAEIDAALVERCAGADLPAAAIIELVSWLAMLQLLHRLGCWIEPPGGVDHERSAR